ncbi:MAG: potassium-transporting ATPase subunit KdpC [Bryobacterales bacterium]
MSLIRTALVTFTLLTIVTGAGYPLVMTAVAQLLFPREANGSLIVRDGETVGSTLIGQEFQQAGYFWGRLSATSPSPYQAAASSGSNLGPLSTNLHAAAKQRLEALRAADPGAAQGVPVDLVTSSGSGLDPHISPAAAYYQAGRVARSRGLTVERVGTLINTYTEGRSLGFLGEPRVNVLVLNLALDEQATQTQ